MGGLLQPTQIDQEPSSNMRPILLGVVLVVVLVTVIVLLDRPTQKGPAGPPPYAANLKLSDLKLSAAENFVGASVTYIDGTVTNDGDKTIIHAVIHASFKNSLDQVVQTEDIPLHVLQTSGPYPEAVDLNASPLAPRQSKPFRLTFEHISADWNQAYPELSVTDVTVR
jgi:hypothetical protein